MIPPEMIYLLWGCIGFWYGTFLYLFYFENYYAREDSTEV